MPSSVPRRCWHSSMTVPTNSLGRMIVERTIGSRMRATFCVGNSLGFVTTISSPSSLNTR